MKSFIDNTKYAQSLRKRFGNKSVIDIYRQFGPIYLSLINQNKTITMKQFTEEELTQLKELIWGTNPDMELCSLKNAINQLHYQLDSTKLKARYEAMGKAMEICRVIGISNSSKPSPTEQVIETANKIYEWLMTDVNTESLDSH